MAKKSEIAIHSSQIEMVAVDKITPYPKNTRTHPKEQIDALMDSIRENGFTAPILLDPKKVIIAGHGRLEAAKALGMQEVPCVIVKGLAPGKLRALRVSDNAMAELSQWDMGALKFEVTALSEMGIDLAALKLPDLEPLPEAEPKTRAPGNPQLGYNLVFDDVEQQAAFFAFIRKLKAKYPEKATLAARLDEFIKETV